MTVAQLYKVKDTKIDSFYFESNELYVQFSYPRMYGTFAYSGGLPGKRSASMVEIRDGEERKLTIGKSAIEVLEKKVNKVLNDDLSDEKDKFDVMK